MTSSLHHHNDITINGDIIMTSLTSTDHHSCDAAISSFLSEENDVCVSDFLYFYYVTMACFFWGGWDLEGGEGGGEGGRERGRGREGWREGGGRGRGEGEREREGRMEGGGREGEGGRGGREGGRGGREGREGGRENSTSYTYSYLFTNTHTGLICVHAHTTHCAHNVVIAMLSNSYNAHTILGSAVAPTVLHNLRRSNFDSNLGQRRTHCVCGEIMQVHIHVHVNMV